MTTKYFRLNLIFFLICFFTIEAVGPVDILEGFTHSDIETETEIARPVIYKLTKIPVSEKIVLAVVAVSLPKKHQVEPDPLFIPASHSTHNFFISGAKLAREISTNG